MSNDDIKVNLPFERLPQYESDPGFGQVHRAQTSDTWRTNENDGGQVLVRGIDERADKYEGSVLQQMDKMRARIAALEMERDEVKAREMERAITEPVAYRWMAPDYSGFMYGIAHGDLPEHCRPIPLYAEPQGPPDLEGTVTFLGKALVKATAATVAERKARKTAEEKLREAVGALKESRAALEAANGKDRGPICDTIWMPGRPETLFDFMDAAIDAAKDGGGA